jgi:hypothetical protein
MPVKSGPGPGTITGGAAGEADGPDVLADEDGPRDLIRASPIGQPVHPSVAHAEA